MLLRTSLNKLVATWCREDLDYFTTAKIDGHSDPEVKNRLQHVAQSGFKRISYTEAIDILSKAIQEYKPQKKGDKLFEFPVCPTALETPAVWDLQTQQKKETRMHAFARFICMWHFQPRGHDMTSHHKFAWKLQ